MDYIISHSRLTATSVLIYTGHEDAGAILPFTIYASDGTTVVESISANDPRWNAVEMSSILITGLTPSTTYIAKLDQSSSTSTTFTTLDDLPKIAKESQWVDLANRVKALQNGGNFTTSEVDTGCTWIDGEKIYKKTIVTGDLSGTGTLEKDHNITNFSFPVAIQGWGLDGNAGEFRTLPYVRGEDMTVTGIGIAITPTKIRIMRNASYNINNSWITIWYTKSS